MYKERRIWKLTQINEEKNKIKLKKKNTEQRTKNV